MNTALPLSSSDYIRSNKVCILYGNAKPSAYGIIIISSAIWLGMFQVVSPVLLGGWSVVMILIAIRRLWLNKLFNAQYTPEKAPYWGRKFALNTTIAGIGWGVLCLFPLLMEQVAHQTAIILIILGVMGASVPLLASYLPAFTTSSLPSAIVLPVIIFSQLEGAAFLLTFAVLLFEFLIYHLSFKTNRAFEKSYRLQYENAHLVKNLQREVDIRTETQRKLEYHQHNLKGLVEERTEQLESSNQDLLNEIKEREEAEAERERLRRELDQTHKMEALGQLTGGIAHDFNNILGVILGYSELLDRQIEDDAVPKGCEAYLGNVIKASLRARDLVSQMLTFSRSDAQDARLIDLVPHINDQITMLRSIIPSSVEIDFEHEEDLPCISIDPSKFQQLLMNLSVNARDAMEGVGTLTIRAGWARRMDIECTACHARVTGDWICISVGDTGSGIPDDVMQHLFEPFFTTKEVGKGTGMGLSVLHGIVRGHGGHTLVETEEGVGTTFRILLPPARGECAEPSEPKISLADLPRGDGFEVMVVDDETALASLVGDLLRLHGYTVAVQTDSRDALALFEENPARFDLLITDQTMPGLTGVELAKCMRHARPSLPVILCTGYSEHVNADDVRKLTMCYLAKPVDAHSLIKHAGHLLTVPAL